MHMRHVLLAVFHCSESVVDETRCCLSVLSASNTLPYGHTFFQQLSPSYQCIVLTVHLNQCRFQEAHWGIRLLLQCGAMQHRKMSKIQMLHNDEEEQEEEEAGEDEVEEPEEPEEPEPEPEPEEKQEEVKYGNA
ncbi:unnamed protein product [Anisakis simplex]|uniref:Nucleolin-like n=1 Tax=Anisakis simplex TaxID=6269 RepID=A0A0M3K8T2_ANISI|nr:unnamed protein product [Anisakis simplex]